MATALIELGSNIDPERHLPAAAARLKGLGRIGAVSMVYENSAIGPRGQPDFLNAAIRLETGLEPHKLRSALRRIEDKLGRRRGDDAYAPRTIDLDLCLYDSMTISTPELTLPDPDLLERAYLARTASEVAPLMIHPVTGERLDEIAARIASGARLKARPDVAEALSVAAGAGPSDSSA